jgi:hypothetical protein
MAQSRLKVTAFKTSDDKQFEDKAEAYSHQNYLDICELWENCTIGSAHEFYEMLKENRTLLAELVRLTATPRNGGVENPE